MLPLIPFAIQIAPMIAKWLFGSGSDEVVHQVGTVISQVTGVADPHTDLGSAAVEAVLRDRPELSMQIQVELAKIAAGREADASRAIEASRKADLDTLLAEIADTDSARRQTTTLAQSGSKIAYGAPVVSALVLITFAVVMTLAFTRSLPAGSETILNMLLGTLAAMATSVVSYWVGSSAGSARKDEHIAQLASSQPTAA
jgi:hypothetical protein